MVVQKIIFSSVLIFCCLLAACSGGATDSQDGAVVTDYTGCNLPSDQGTGSFEGEWAHAPIPLIFDRDFYLTDNGSALPALRSAVNTWNGWSALRGFQAFSIVNDGTGQSAGEDIPVITTCAQASFTAAVTDKVGIWKIRQSGDGANARAACGTTTTTTTDPTTGAVTTTTSPGLLMATGIQGRTDWIVQSNKITGASILLNFDGFNSPGTQQLDVESLLLHELGHVLGLLHSCNGGNGDLTAAPSCQASIPNAYLIAVMFPFLNVGQLRRVLTQNDLSRVNCLY